MLRSLLRSVILSLSYLKSFSGFHCQRLYSDSCGPQDLATCHCSDLIIHFPFSPHTSHTGALAIFKHARCCLDSGPLNELLPLFRNHLCNSLSHYPPPGFYSLSLSREALPGYPIYHCKLSPPPISLFFFP